MNGQDNAVTYGASEHYQGERGQAYLAWQATGGDLRGQLNCFKFAPYIKPTDVVLDFGCSDGALLSALPGGRKLGVEINPHALARAQARDLVVYPSLTAVADASIDVVVSNHVLEHIPNPHGALVELRRVLRPGGRVVVCVPAEDWRNSPHWRGGDINHHLYTWTPLTLGNLLDEAGLVVARVEMLSHAWPPFYPQLFQWLPRPVFDCLCWMWSGLKRQRQIVAVAHRQ